MWLLSGRTTRMHKRATRSQSAHEEPEALAHPAVHPTPEELAAERPFLHELFRRLGFDRCDVEDSVGETLLQAWSAIGRDQYRPPPDRPPRRSLRAWLFGISRNVGSHLRDKAYRRREILVPEIDP